MLNVFDNIPGNLRVPFWSAEVRSAQTPYVSTARLLLIGQMLPTGTAIAGEAVQVIGDAEGMFGSGSMAHLMYDAARLNAPYQEIWFLPLEDAAASVAATGTITTQNMPVAQATTVSVWIAGTQVSTIAYANDTNDTLAARLNTVIGATAGLPVTATVAANVITLTAVNKGEAANSIRLDVDLLGSEGPASANAFVLGQFSGGTGNPDLTTFLPALGDDEFDWIAAPYSDAVNMGAMSLFLNNVSGRWSPMQQKYGHYITVYNGGVAASGTYGNTLNDPHLTVMGTTGSQTPDWGWAAALGAVCAKHLQDAPELSRPLQTLKLLGVRPAKDRTVRPNKTSRQALYFDGISSYTVNKAGEVLIDRVLTTYQTNEWGSPDGSWLDINTIAQTVFGLRYMRADMEGNWGRVSLVDENPDNAPGVASVDDLRNQIVMSYRKLCDLNVFENPDEFAEQVIVERNSQNPDGVDFYLPTDHVNAFRIARVAYVSHQQYA